MDISTPFAGFVGIIIAYPKEKWQRESSPLPENLFFTDFAGADMIRPPECRLQVIAIGDNKPLFPPKLIA